MRRKVIYFSLIIAVVACLANLVSATIREPEIDRQVAIWVALIVWPLFYGVLLALLYVWLLMSDVVEPIGPAKKMQEAMKPLFPWLIYAAMILMPVAGLTIAMLRLFGVSK